MISREEKHKGTIEFDVIMNGEVTQRVDNGLLAYVNKEEKGLQIMAQGINPVLMANTIVALITYLLDHNHGDLLIKVMEELDKKFK